MVDGDKTASVESHEALAMLREAMRRFHGPAQDTIANLRHKAAQSLSEIEQAVQAQQRYVDSLESDAASSDDEDDGGNAAEVAAAQEKLAELEAAQTEAETIAAQIELAVARLATQLNELIPRATAFLSSKLDILNEKAAICLDRVNAPAMPYGVTSPAGPSISNRLSSDANVPTAPPEADSLISVPLPEGFHWVTLSDIDLPNELSGVASPKDFKKVDYATMRRGLETFRNEVLPTLNSNHGKSLWDLNSIFRGQDAASSISYEHGVQRAFEAFFSQEDAIYLTRGRQEKHFRIVNGRHRIKAALDAGWTAIPARTKDLRQ